ncbi:hypothetical protein CARN8_4730002 [mine drainage metagenome]|uniref:Uncharacterized protein n=1 Tax=mine drainage metagenome TaxID=410659 RepID=A0A3P3ZQ48_9ZZZZ
MYKLSNVRAISDKSSQHIVYI